MHTHTHTHMRPHTPCGLQEIEAYRATLPFLKTTMRGAGWEEGHWLQLFQVLGLKTTGANAVSRETVTLAHFLDVADSVVRFGCVCVR